MPRWIISVIELYWVFSVVERLSLIPYYLSIKLFLNKWTINSFPQSYVIIVGKLYLHNHFCSTIFAIVAACFSLYHNIWNHPVAGSIIAEAFSMKGSSWTSIISLYGPTISTNNLSHGMASSSLVGNLLYLRGFCIFDKYYKPLFEYV